MATFHTGWKIGRRYLSRTPDLTVAAAYAGGERRTLLPWYDQIFDEAVSDRPNGPEVMAVQIGS